MQRSVACEARMLRRHIRRLYLTFQLGDVHEFSRHTMAKISWILNLSWITKWLQNGFDRSWLILNNIISSPILNCVVHGQPLEQTENWSKLNFHSNYDALKEKLETKLTERESSSFVPLQCLFKTLSKLTQLLVPAATRQKVNNKLFRNNTQCRCFLCGSYYSCKLCRWTSKLSMSNNFLLFNIETFVALNGKWM